MPNFLEKLLTGGMAEPASNPDGFFTRIARTTQSTTQSCDNCTVVNQCCLRVGNPQQGRFVSGTGQPPGGVSDGFDLLAWNINRGRDMGVAREY